MPRPIGMANTPPLTTVGGQTIKQTCKLFSRHNSSHYHHHTTPNNHQQFRLQPSELWTTTTATARQSWTTATFSRLHPAAIITMSWWLTVGRQRTYAHHGLQHQPQHISYIHGKIPNLRTATEDEIKVTGYKWVYMTNMNNQQIVIPFYVCAVTQPILSVTRQAEQGFTIQLSEQPTITQQWLPLETQH